MDTKNKDEVQISGRETKRQRFIRIAEARTNKIIEMVKLLGNCSSKANYDYSDEDVRKIFNAIDKELKIVRSKFSDVDGNEEKFTLR